MKVQVKAVTSICRQGRRMESSRHYLLHSFADLNVSIPLKDTDPLLCREQVTFLLGVFWKGHVGTLPSVCIHMHFCSL